MAKKPSRSTGTGARHPRPERRRQMRPVAMFEADHQPRRDRTVAHRRARPVECRGRCRAAGAQRPFAEIEVERHAASGTVRWRDEIDFAPTRAAQPPGLVRRRATGNAMRRQQQVERAARPIGGDFDDMAIFCHRR